MDGRSGMEGDRERKNTGRKEREREEWVSNERRSRHKVNRYGACSSQGLTALRFVVSTFSPPRFLAPLSSLPSIAAPRADYASPCVGDANRAPLVRRKFAIVAVPSFSILPSPESLRSSLLNPVPARFCAWQWEENVEILFCFLFLYYVFSCTHSGYSGYSLLSFCQGVSKKVRNCGNGLPGRRSETTELWNSKWKSIGQ